ncbi:MAG: trypsin-like peptidase domain-containing protein, partial [Bacillota bacterium]|nr:trypsin-like peptidase domain-containing protein [Bacillota bacterium]
MKKIISLFVALTVLFTVAVSAESSVVVDGKNVGDTIMVGDKVYVPLRTVSESLGGSVAWDEKSQTAYVSSAQANDAIIPKIVAEASEYVVGIIGQYKGEEGEGVAHGSGFVIGENGLILTNAHVVASMTRILVVMSDGNGYEAKIKNIDSEADIALIQIDKTGLKTAHLADMSTAEVGQTVIAIGTPISFSLRNSATIGIISGLNRSADNAYRLIQSDATLNGGNSGGPLINLKGEVVGMSTQGIVGVGVSGLYFSVTADTIKYALDHFEKYGKIRRPKLGATLSEGLLAKYDL